MSLNPNVIWTTLFAAGAAYEAYAIANKVQGDTLSERVRALFNVKRKPGRGLFVVAWAGFSVWFLFHIAFSSL
ncbi:hypothetical protein [Streptomyces californicus]|uniref:hypothetical protein n=1 Tax=Streptomyces californicus TaxID=67351 RepID=UPI0036B0F9AC